MASYEEKRENIPYQNTIQSELAKEYNLNSDNIKLFVYRPRKLSGFAIEYNVNVSDSLSARMYNGNYELIELDKSGEYKISAKTEDNKVIIVTLEKGKTYYLRCTVGVGLFIGRPKFDFVEPYVGEGDIYDLRNREQKKKNK